MKLYLNKTNRILSASQNGTPLVRLEGHLNRLVELEIMAPGLTNGATAVLVAKKKDDEGGAMIVRVPAWTPPNQDAEGHKMAFMLDAEPLVALFPDATVRKVELVASLTVTEMAGPWDSQNFAFEVKRPLHLGDELVPSPIAPPAEFFMTATDNGHRMRLRVLSTKQLDIEDLDAEPEPEPEP